MTADADIKDEEMEAIEELKKRLEGDVDPEMYEDIYLFYRFLKARDFDVDTTEVMLRKHLKWLEEKDVKNILNYKKPEVVEKYLAHIFLGYDKEGCVVRYAPMGNMDFIGIINSLKFQDIEKTLIYENEDDTYRLKLHSKELGRNVDQCVYIYNLEHFSFTMATDKKVVYYLIFLLNLYQDHYPERMKAAYILNASIYFSMVYAVLKNFLAKSILNKIHIYSDDSWKEDILKVVDAEVLPAFLGGKRTDPDGNPLCLTFINHGEPVPEKYFIHKSKRSLASFPDVKKIVLSRAAYHEEILDVKEPGSCFEWEFETKCRDIGFGVFYADVSDGEEKMVELIPHQRIDTEEYSETGTYLCEKAGKYVFLFDNTYSWIRSKEIYYRIKIVTPKEQESQLKYE